MSRCIPGPAGQFNSPDVLVTNVYMSGETERTLPTPFEQGSWLQMRRDLMPDFRDQLTILIADIVDGTYDLRIPRLVAMVTAVSPAASGDWVVELQDPTGVIGGFISTKHMTILQERKLSFGVGSTLLLEQVSVFVSAAPVIKRHLCIHSKCITTVWR